MKLNVATMTDENVLGLLIDFIDKSPELVRMSSYNQYPGMPIIRREYRFLKEGEGLAHFAVVSIELTYGGMVPELITYHGTEKTVYHFTKALPSYQDDFVLHYKNGEVRQMDVYRVFPERGEGILLLEVLLDKLNKLP